MSAVDEARLRELAEAAKDGGLSSGLWSDDPHTGWIACDADNGYRVHVADVRGWGYLTGQGDVCLKLGEETAYAIQKRWGAFIAAANPATILALLDALSAERERGDRAVGLLRRIADATNPDDPESYRCDDREGCLDTVYALATQKAEG